MPLLYAFKAPIICTCSSHNNNTVIVWWIAGHAFYPSLVFHTPPIKKDAASAWWSRAAVLQHSGPFQVGACPPEPVLATKCRVPGDHLPCCSSRSAAHPMGSSLFGKDLACAPLLGCPFAEPIRCIWAVASAVFTACTSFFGSASIIMAQ